jgi:cardiolipin-specific phospholipase
MSTLTYSEPPSLPTSATSSFVKVSDAGSFRVDSPNPSRPIPTDFRGSLAAWWSSNGYRDARIAEDRLLRRLSYYQPAPEVPAKKCHTFAAGSAAAEVAAPAVHATPSATGLIATLRNVHIPTPDPELAPQHPDELPVAASSASSASSTTSHEKKKHHHLMSLHQKHDDGKLVDYINTLEISRPDLENSKEAVVVLHGYAAALG